MMELRERYHEDSHFRALVDQMHAFMRAGDFTPSEIRLASMLAAIQYESMNLHRIVVQAREIESAAMRDHDIDARVRDAAIVLQSEIDRVRKMEGEQMSVNAYIKGQIAYQERIRELESVVAGTTAARDRRAEEYESRIRELVSQVRLLVTFAPAHLKVPDVPYELDPTMYTTGTRDGDEKLRAAVMEIMKALEGE